MIFPIPENPKQFDRTPILWTLVSLNVLLYFLVFFAQPEVSQNEEFLKDKNLERTGLVYLEYRQQPYNLGLMSSDQLQVNGIKAIRDSDFLKKIELLSPVGDEVQFAKWKTSAIRFRDQFLSQKSSIFGLSYISQSSLSWVTYQFSHASLMHLFSNMVYLIILGTIIELQVGGLALILIYLCGGIAGGVFFINMGTHSLTPVVGASGSVSALLGFYSIFEAKKNIRYFFFLTPLKNHFGHIYLPAVWIIPLYLLADWVSFLSSPPGWGGSVAFTAHLGGSFFGLLLGFTMRYLIKVKPYQSLHL